MVHSGCDSLSCELWLQLRRRRHLNRMRTIGLFVWLTLASTALALDEQDLDNALTGLKKVARFFRDDAADINPDALFGIRIAQGQLEAVSRLVSMRVLALPSRRAEELRQLSGILNETAQITLSNRQHRKDAYFGSFRLLLDRPFASYFTSKHINTSKKSASNTSMRDYDEEYGDSCYKQLMATGEYSGKSCFISDDCWKFMSKAGNHGYTLTHQLLYFMIGEMFCRSELNKRLTPTKTEDIFQKLCQGIFEDSAALSEGDKVSHGMRDLFSEQNLLCSVVGFDEFLSSKRLNLVLSWQDNDTGCFGKIFDYGKTRKKRTQSFMKDGCLGHISGLVAGLLGAYVRKSIMDVYGVL